jgi:VCBS repeat protein
MRNAWRLLSVSFLLAPPALSGADCNSNGIPDEVDLSSGAELDCNGNGVPDSCEVRRSFAFIGQQALTDTDPVWTRAADVDGDQWPDLVAASPEGSRVYFGLGGGKLGGAMEVSSQGGPFAAGDLDGDGDLDIAMGASRELPGGVEQAGVIVELQTSRRGFELKSDRSIPVAAGALTAADLDGDGLIDVLASSAGATWFFRGQGDGTLSEPRVISGAGGDMTAGDFDGDGDLDLAVSDPAASDPLEAPGNILLNDGRGSVVLGGAIQGGGGGLAAGDFDGDGDLDLASGWGAMNWNAGRATFESRRVVYNFSRSPSGNLVAAGDIDGDGDVDPVWSRGGTVSALLDDGQHELAEEVDIDTLSAPCIDLADFDLDGRLDLAAGGSVLLNLGGTRDFGKRVYGSNPDWIYPLESVCADFDGDALLDLAMFGPSDSLSVLLNRGQGLLTPESEVVLDGYAAFPLAQDLDGDGRVDLAFVDQAAGEAVIAWNEGRLKFPMVRFPMIPQPVSLRAADLDGDRAPDLLTTGEFVKQVIVLHNDGNRRFAPPVALDVAHQPSFAVPLDFDGDRDLDLAVGWWEKGGPPGALSLYLNDGRGSFSTGPVIVLEGSPEVASAGDWNGDGRDDLAIGMSVTLDCSPLSGCVKVGRTSILLSDGQGAFRPVPIEGPKLVPDSLVPADLDGDGALDLAVLWGWLASSDVLITADMTQAFLNRGAEGFLPAARSPVGSAHLSLLAGDLNGDGMSDLIATSISSVSVIFSNASSLARDENHDGVPDECRLVLFRRGDANRDALVDISDAVSILSDLFLARPVEGCDKAEDVNDDGSVDISDVVAVLDHLFLNGSPLPPPAGSCGSDPTVDRLSCEPLPPCN